MVNEEKTIRLSSKNKNAFYAAYCAARSLHPIEFGELLKVIAQEQRNDLAESLKERPERDQIDRDITANIEGFANQLEALGNNIISAHDELSARPAFLLKQEEVTTD